MDAERHRETALVTSYYGREDATGPAGEPMATVTGDPRHALVVPINGGRHGHGGHKVRTAEDPLLTQTADLARALVVPTDHATPGAGNQATPVDRPLRTQVSIQADVLVYHGQHHNHARPARDPLSTATSGTNVGLVEPPPAFLASHYRSSRPTSSDEPMNTVTGHDRHGLAEGPVIAIEDCFFRMLEPHEIQAGMAFPGAYVVLGNKRERVRQLGQAVTPPVLRWIVGRIAESLG